MFDVIGMRSVEMMEGVQDDWEEGRGRGSRSHFLDPVLVLVEVLVVEVVGGGWKTEACRKGSCTHHPRDPSLQQAASSAVSPLV